MPLEFHSRKKYLPAQTSHKYSSVPLIKMFLIKFRWHVPVWPGLWIPAISNLLFILLHAFQPHRRLLRDTQLTAAIGPLSLLSLLPGKLTPEYLHRFLSRIIQSLLLRESFPDHPAIQKWVPPPGISSTCATFSSLHLLLCTTAPVFSCHVYSPGIINK